MTLKEYNEKMADLKAKGAALAKAGKLDEAKAVKAEIDQLTDTFEAEKVAKGEEDALQDDHTVPDAIQNKANLGEENKKMPKFTAGSVEYKNAYLKTLAGRVDLTADETEAFKQVNAATTESADPVMPTTMVNTIWDLITAEHSLVADFQTLRTGTVIEVPVYKSITAGKAKKVAENTAPDAEMAFDKEKVTLSGNDHAAYIDLSYATANMALDALESFITTHIADSLGDVLAEEALTMLTGDKGIATANKISVTGALKYANLAAAFGALKRASNVAVYVTRSVLYNKLATLEDTAGHLIFVPDATAGVAGTLLGAPVKIEDAVGDAGILIGDGKRVINSVITDPMIETDRDIKTHTLTYSGYERSQAQLIDDKSFAYITISAAA